MPRCKRAIAFTALAALVLVAAGCSPKSPTKVAARTTTSTSTTTPTSTTAAPGPTTSSSAAAATTSTTGARKPLAGTTPKAIVTPSGIVAAVLGAQGDGLLVETPCAKQAVVTKGTPLDGATVVLDPGHGGGEAGSVGPNGLTEKALNLAVVGFAKSALEASGAKVVLTRTGDYRIALEARAKIVTNLQPKAFVSVHHNAEPDGPRNGPGTETYYQTVGSSTAASKRLAGLVYEEVVKTLSQYQGISWVADTDAGAKYRKSSSGDDYYGILRRTQGVPAALAELAFISNAPEAELLARPDVEQVEGEAVARGITRYLTTKDPGSGFTEPYPRTEPAGGGGGTTNCVDPPLG